MSSHIYWVIINYWKNLHTAFSKTKKKYLLSISYKLKLKDQDILSIQEHNMNIKYRNDQFLYFQEIAPDVVLLLLLSFK